MSDDLPDHTNYSLIKAVDESGNLVTVLCDASGRIVSVMKGDYAGTMKTLAVDDKGRIQAVLTDPEDVFGNPNYIGAGELAARLGSIKTFEKRGEVIFMDGFEDSTVKWATSATGAGSSVTRSNTSAKTGDYSMELIAAQADPSDAEIIKKLPIPVFKKLGLEASFTVQSGMDRVYLEIYYYDGTKRWQSFIFYEKHLDRLTYLNSVGGLTILASNVKTKADDKLFNTMKYVVDMDQKEYVRCYFNDTLYDMSGLGLNFGASALDPHLEIWILNMANLSEYGTIYVDDVIFTQNEP